MRHLLFFITTINLICCLCFAYLCGNTAAKTAFVILGVILLIIWLILAVSINPANNEKH
jgi:FtsH-binding integral membrane protein